MGPQGPAGPEGPAGPAGGGLNATSVNLGTTALGATAVVLPGELAVTGGAEGTSTALLVADGEIVLATGTFGRVELRISVDGVVVRTLRATTVNAGSTNLATGWSLHALVPLAAGDHVVRVDARVISSNGMVIANTQPGRLTALVF
jgi:hypothetical protein